MQVASCQRLVNKAQPHVCRLSPASAQASTSGPYNPRQQESGKDAAWESKPLLLITTVDIGEGKADKIVLREGDKAEVSTDCAQADRQAP